MSFISNKFPVLRNSLMGWLIITSAVIAMITVSIFQEPVELPKTIAWYVGMGIAAIIFVVKSRTWNISIPKPAFWGLLALAFIWTIGLGFSYDLSNSIFGIFPRYTGSYIFFISWIASTILFGCIAPQKLLTLFKFYVILAVPIGAWGIIQSFGLGYYPGIDAPIRILAPSFLGNPNFSAMYVAAALPLVLWMLSTAKTKVSQYAYLFSVGVMLVSLVIFNSRGALLGAAIGIAAYAVGLMINRSWKQLAIVVVAAGLLFSSFAVFYYQTRVNVVTSQSDITEQTISSRLVLWEVTTSYIKQHPIFGTGFGNFFIAFRSNNHPALANQEWFDDAHNFILHIAATNGVPAALVFLFLFGYAIYICVKQYRSETEPGLDFAVGAGILAWLAVGSFTPVSLPNLLFIALLFVVAWQGKPSRIHYTPTIPVKVLTIVVAGLIILLGLCMLSSELFLWQSKMATEKGNNALSSRLSNDAFRAFPINTNAYINYMDNEMKLGHYNAVEQTLPVFLAQHPASSGLYQVAVNYYSRLYQETGDHKYKTLMYAAISNMVFYNANYANPYRVAALQLVYQHDYVNALPYAQKAAVLDGKDYNTWILVAKIHYELKNYHATYLALQQAYKILPTPPVKSSLAKFKAAKPISAIEFPYQF